MLIVLARLRPVSVLNLHYKLYAGSFDVYEIKYYSYRSLHCRGRRLHCVSSSSASKKKAWHAYIPTRKSIEQATTDLLLLIEHKRGIYGLTGCVAQQVQFRIISNLHIYHVTAKLIIRPFLNSSKNNHYQQFAIKGNPGLPLLSTSLTEI